MKPFDNLDENIDKYYDGSLNKASKGEADLKSILDRMSIAEDLETKVSVNVDISSIVENGEQIRFSKRLRKETFKFLLLAGFLSIFIGFMYMRVSLYITFAIQSILLIFLLMLNQVFLKKKTRREAK
ncbi:hypothetical protein CFOLD11_10740 [Clostridium folliculivorans]|uniref:Uncharacterized protein n=1 Tax=Clostridium folliculivorans TaxID=2886038 RepID=A0A9W5Y0B1_9CLOT|nr:hypothetical protein [Clostridium folliculivorans]GKU24248.1 hypothetical protein CFOLD11_10740 [Clostridium folliculivorans]